MSSDNETEMPSPPSSKLQPNIFTYNAQNPTFVPGYSVLRVENARHLRTTTEKTALINSIVDDLVATFTSINAYHATGLLSDENIAQVLTLLATIGANNVKSQARADARIARLKKEREQVRADYRDLVRRMDVMGQRYAGRVSKLEEEVRMLKGKIAWVEGGKSLRERERERLLQSRVDECVDRRVGEGVQDQDQMVQDDPDGEYEEEI